MDMTSNQNGVQFTQSLAVLNVLPILHIGTKYTWCPKSLHSYGTMSASMLVVPFVSGL